MTEGFDVDVTIVGGCGRAGLPLGLALADRGRRVVLYDINPEAVRKVQQGEMPFLEAGAAVVLERVLGTGLTASVDPAVVGQAESVVVVIGTPIDEFLNPHPNVVMDAIVELSPFLRDGQLLVLRSTLYPGVTALVERIVKGDHPDIDVSYCPERIAEGKAMTELYELPQLVGARDPRALGRAQALFETLTSAVVPMNPEEAELAKLYTNAWRYIKFAIANHFFMMADEQGLNYESIRAALAQDYPRAFDIPRAGLAAGPCLLKDTMHLAALADKGFDLGYAAMRVNEGLPDFIVSRIEKTWDLGALTVGILGMGFKNDSDDVRSSLSYKLKRILRYKAKAVMCHDPLVVVDPDLEPLERILSECDLLIVGAPHSSYRDLATELPVIDVTGTVTSDLWSRVDDVKSLLTDAI
ncbi:MAG: nucleotide sugar dehydrogenase [Acidimicrobiales bacterium]